MPLEPLGAVIREQLDAGAGSTLGLGAGPPLDLGEEGIGICGRIGRFELATDLEQREQCAVALAGLLGRRDLVGAEVEGAGARLRPNCRSASAALPIARLPARPASRAGIRQRAAPAGALGGGPPGRANGGDRTADLGSGEEPLAPDLERHPGRPERGLEPDELAVGANEHGDLLGGDPSETSRPASAATARSSSRPLASCRMSGTGPGGRVGTRRLGGPAGIARGLRASSRLASSRTCGVER